MIKANILLLAALFTVIMVSCDLFSDINELGPLEENSFYAQNMDTGNYYQVKAEMLYEGKRCVIWAEKNARVTEEMARKFALEYDTVIRPGIVEKFSRKDFSIKEKDEIYDFDDMLDYANRLADRNDNKLTILLLDIQDGFKDPKKDSYVAGYFFGGNFYQKGNIGGSKHYSNGRDMIYVDTYPGLKTDPRQTYATFAHELQHLINYVTSLQMNRPFMDLWIDEGLSSQAEYFYLKENLRDKCEWFVNDKEGTIAKGNNFFVWGNHSEKSMAILDDYATVYLFFRWLYLQASANTELQSHIFLDIETSSNVDYRAVTDVARQINPAWGDWETLLGTWLAANYAPKSSYGYIGDDYLKRTITVKPIADQRISLYPGEGVYSIINDSFSAETSGSIRYTGLAENETITGASPYTGNMLLTFNANTDCTAKTETAVLTGVSPAVPPTGARNIQTGKPTGPYVIDARDMLNKNKFEF
jgi:hypothetical protein